MVHLKKEFHTSQRNVKLVWIQFRIKFSLFSELNVFYVRQPYSAFFSKFYISLFVFGKKI